uniref:Uncharacterized protein n=1 Tax=Schistosoma haematobium TaxID=6185 RepID=A0A095C2B6_SCHHA
MRNIEKKEHVNHSTVYKIPYILIDIRISFINALSLLWAYSLDLYASSPSSSLLSSSSSSSLSSLFLNRNHLKGFIAV